MELGGLSEFRYVPEWKGNRDLPEGERLSLNVRRLRGIDLMSDDSEEDLFAWRDDAYSSWKNKAEWPSIARIPAKVLSILRMVAEHTSGYRNFCFGGEPVTNPLEIFLRIGMPAGTDQSGNLLFEINGVLAETANMTADELGNYVAQFGGGTGPSEGNARPAREDSGQ